MDDITLRKVQLCQLEIAKEFRRVCEQLDLNYFLDSGTLLGAVRHKGFIPWDDDLDVGMLRTDYNLFLDKAPNILSSQFYLQTWYSDNNYGLAFSKLRMKNTVYLEEASSLSSAETGFYIDIFPYDVFPSIEKDRKWQGKRYELYRRAIMVKSNYTPWIMNASGIRLVLKWIGYLPIRIYAAANSRKNLIEKYEKMCTKYNGNNSGFLFEQAGASNYGKWVIPEECFSEYVLIQFEGEFFSCPKDYDKYLQSAYGDYMTLPPEDKRVNRHRIIEIKFPDNME